MSEQPPPIDLSALDAIPELAWAALAQKRIYFGHKSVGDNIVAGIREVMRLRPRIRLRIVDTAEPASLAEPGFAHSHLGTNGDPNSKFKAFADVLASGIGDQADIAMFKLCYADIGVNTDPNRVFESYRGTISDLRCRFPRVAFVHVTTPLTTIQTGIKAAIKWSLGRPLSGHVQNCRREEYNAFVRSTYGPDGCVVDLAATQSVQPDGTAVVFRRHGSQVRCLAREYTCDGGHLNQVGRLIAAMQVLSVLAQCD